MLEGQEEFDKLCEKQMAEIFEGLTGFISYQPGEKEENEKKDVFLTYGEVLYPGINTLIDYVEVTHEDVICDLGSGIGKVPMQFFLKTPIRRAFGIEASKTRYESSLKALARFKERFNELFQNGARSLEYFNGNFLEGDMSQVTLVYAASTCYGPKLMEKIGEMVDKAPKVRCVMSLKPVPCNTFRLDKVLEVQCSWDKATKCHVYLKNDS